jgi:hypothetical protein
MGSNAESNLPRPWKQRIKAATRISNSSSPNDRAADDEKYARADFPKYLNRGKKGKKSNPK